MPRVWDLRGLARGSNDVHSPLRGLLNFNDPLGQIAKAAQDAGTQIKGQFDAALDGTVAFIKATTGIDLTSWATLIHGIEDEIGTVLGGAQNALTSLTQIPSYLLSGLQPGASHNLLPDPFFAAADFLEGSGLWNWSALAPALTPPGAGSATVTASGDNHQLLGVPIAIPPVDQLANPIVVGASVFWQDVVSAGQSFVVAVNSYSGLNADGTLIEPPLADPGRVVAAITDPLAASAGHAGADANGFVPISGEWLPPAGTQFAALSLEVADAATAGIVHFGSGIFNLPSVIDAAKLGNVANIPMLPKDNIEGLFGQAGMGQAVQAVNDTLYETITETITSGETSLSNLVNALQTLLGMARNGQTLGTNAINIASVIDNQMVSNGLESTIEANMPLQVLGSGPSYVQATQANSRGAPVRLSKAKNIGFAQIWAYASGTVTGFYLNFYRQNDTGGLDWLYTSANLAASLPTSAANANWLLYDIPGSASDIPVAAGDTLAVGCQVVGSGSVFIAGVDQSSWMTNHPSSRTKRTGFSQNWGTGAAASLAAGAVGWTGAAPYIGLGVSTIGADYQPPESASYPNAGSYTYNFPAWLAPGDYIQYAAIGAGGGGMPGAGYGLDGQGGSPGGWAAGQLRYGDGYDIPTAVRSLNIGVGLAGLNGVPFDGSRPTPGGNSYVQIPGGATYTAGGGASHNGGYGDHNGYGASPSTITVDGIVYQAGGTQTNYANNGIAPGGGGAGGNGTTQAYGYGGYGANGEVWLRAKRGT